jgi:hypothetical protein
MFFTARIGRRKKTSEVLLQELESWKRTLRQLPEARLDKVAASREALRRNAYESEEVLDETVARLSADVSGPTVAG